MTRQPHTPHRRTTTQTAVSPVATGDTTTPTATAATATPVAMATAQRAATSAIVATTNPAAHMAPNLATDVATDTIANTAAMAGQSAAASTRAAVGVAGLTASADLASAHDHTPGHGRSGHGHDGDLGCGRRGRGGRWPVGAGLADRLVGEFITFCSVALLMVGVGRWLARLGLGVPAPSGDGLAAGVAQNQIPGPITLQQFLSNIQVLIFGVLGTLTVTLFLVGFARWIAAHEAEEYEAAKKSLKNSAKGFVGALLSTTFVQILQSLVQGQGR